MNALWIAESLIHPSRFLDGYRSPLLVLIISAIITGILTPKVRKFALKKGFVDDPKIDSRRVHKSPIPKLGGLALYVGIVVSLLIILPYAFPDSAFHSYITSILIVGFLILVMGMIDDVYQLPAKFQAIFLLSAGFLVQYLAWPSDHLQITGIHVPFLARPGDPSGFLSFGWLAWPITAIYIFVVTKITDTIDGLDGLAAGIAGIAGVTLTVVGVYTGQPRIALLAAAIAGSAVGFLKYNFNPARIFMGTAGSQLLGFMLACISVVGAIKSTTAVAMAVPLFVFGVPIFDAIFVITKRIISRSPITQADKRHIHHTLIQYGFNQKQAVLLLYIATALLCTIILFIMNRNF